MIRFIKKVATAVKDGLVWAVKSIVCNIEAVTILTLAAVGLTGILSQLPFVITLPLWIESTIVTYMLLPIISELIISLLVGIMIIRMRYEICC